MCVFVSYLVVGRTACQDCLFRFTYYIYELLVLFMHFVLLLYLLLTLKLTQEVG